jgi:hypothetical protein
MPWFIGGYRVFWLPVPSGGCLLSQLLATILFSRVFAALYQRLVCGQRFGFFLAIWVDNTHIYIYLLLSCKQLPYSSCLLNWHTSRSCLLSTGWRYQPDSVSFGFSCSTRVNMQGSETDCVFVMSCNSGLCGIRPLQAYWVWVFCFRKSPDQCLTVFLTPMSLHTLLLWMHAVLHATNLDSVFFVMHLSCHVFSAHSGSQDQSWIQFWLLFLMLWIYHLFIEKRLTNFFVSILWRGKVDHFIAHPFVGGVTVLFCIPLLFLFPVHYFERAGVDWCPLIWNEYFIWIWKIL